MSFQGFGGWAVALNGVILTSSCENGQDVWDESECADDSVVIDGLTDTPDGLGLPGLRTEDITFLQRDGVKHFADWYDARLITLKATIGPNSDCVDGDDCVTTREQLFALGDAFGRVCCDTEMVLWTPCAPGETQAERAFTGPYGVVGRPRVFQHNWQYRDDQVADVLMRFDAVDQRLYILDACGTPGYSNCEEIVPGSEVSSMCFVDGTLCFGGGVLCFDTPLAGSVEPTEITVVGTERVSPLITFYPDLSSPRIENVTTGETIRYNGVVTGSPVVVNTEDGTAFQDGISVTHLLSGSFLFSMAPGTYEIRLLSSGADDTGTAQFCWRDTVKLA